MRPSAACSTSPLIALAIAMLSLAACGTASSDIPSDACAPVIEYSQAEQARVADEVAALADHAVILEWLADHAVLRDQARACRTGTAPR